MNNLVLIRVVLTSANAPIAPKRLVATFTLAVPPKNSEDAVITDGKTGSIDLPAGTQYGFEKIDLSELLIRGKAGEEVFVVGHTV